MDPHGQIYALEDAEKFNREGSEAEDVARLDGYIRARAENDLREMERRMREAEQRA